MKTLFSAILFLSSLTLLASSEKPKVYENDVFVPYVKSVKFHLSSVPISYPLIELGSRSQLVLTFDDLQDEVKNYYYTIVHCNADWTPSDMSTLEYIEGFDEGEILDYEYSFNTRIQFTNYRLFLPNDDVGWKLSGNYALLVYAQEASGRKLVFTRRFMVVEPLFQIKPQIMPTARVNKSQTHQEFDFVVSHEGIDIRNPLLEVQATVLQNGRWDNAIKGLAPKFTRPEQLVFDYQDKVVFPAGKEFRHLDIRSLEYNTDKVMEIDRFKDRYELTLYAEKSRAFSPYLYDQDINGDFVIETLDRQDNALESDYVDVFFTLDVTAPLFDSDVYVVGGFSDWKLREPNRLVYNDINTSYIGRIQLKQGFYNYVYVAVDREIQEPDFEILEGNWYEAENDYLILVYYHPFGQRYDRLVAARTFSSTD